MLYEANVVGTPGVGFGPSGEGAARMSSFRNIWWSLANEYDFLRELKPEYWDTFTHTVVAVSYTHLYIE